MVATVLMESCCNRMVVRTGVDIMARYQLLCVLSVQMSGVNRAFTYLIIIILNRSL